MALKKVHIIIKIMACINKYSCARGLEITVKVVTEMEVTTRQQFKQLFVSSYKEPDRNGLFDNCTREVLQELQHDNLLIQTKRARTTKFKVVL